MRIAIIGTGYVGLVTGACFAQAGHRVTCVDVDQPKINLLNKGKMPIYEPGLSELITKGRQQKALDFSSDARAVAASTEAVFLAVGTPSSGQDGSADLTNLYEAIREIAPALQDGCLVVIKSTVPVGTGEEVQRLIERLRPELDFDVASNPEFLRAGCAIQDFKMPDRVVIGADSERALDALSGLYCAMGIEPTRVVATQRRAAELIKYAANGFLATKIAFINEIADLCEKVDARVGDVALGIGLDCRIGRQFLNAGPGFGGSCFPKDARALAKAGAEHGTPMRIIEAVLASNETRKRSIAAKIRAASGGDLQGKTIALLGLTFKAGTDDMREAPSIDLVQALVEHGAIVHAYDPVGIERAKPLLPECVRYHRTALDAASGAAAAVIVTEWDEFRHLDLARLKRRMAAPLLIDLKNMLSAEQVTGRGFKYCAIGNGTSPTRDHAFKVWSKPRATAYRTGDGTGRRPSISLNSKVVAAE
ncbi:MAG: UDP-glucose 6-dehydrogenase [Alphaproteobacteria bacterium 13_1_20CM_3_64_12]|nr:MAG: UDP-glucose 6-dehydrogenase [Alphaproteobacteria bacterium 13_1_20CM_3_64_12]